jgi:hypothetical protein
MEHITRVLAHGSTNELPIRICLVIVLVRTTQSAWTARPICQLAIAGVVHDKKVNLDILCHPTLFISAKITAGKNESVSSHASRHNWHRF